MKSSLSLRASIPVALLVVFLSTNALAQNETTTESTTKTTTESTSNTTTETPDCSPSNIGIDQMQVARIALTDANGARVDLNVLVADDNLERASGYQFICPEVIARTAILFRYDAPSAGAFHMRNVHAPLDIAFFDGNGILIQSMLMQPYTDGGDEILYAPMQPFQYAIEARANFFAERELRAGESRLLLHTLPP